MSVKEGVHSGTVSFRIPLEMYNWYLDNLPEGKTIHGFAKDGLVAYYEKKVGIRKEVVKEKEIPRSPYWRDMQGLIDYEPLKHVKGSVCIYNDKDVGHKRRARVITPFPNPTFEFF